MQRWRGCGTLELARALAIGRSANHSFGNNRLHTLHTKDTRELAEELPVAPGPLLSGPVFHLRSGSTEFLLFCLHLFLASTVISSSTKIQFSRSFPIILETFAEFYLDLLQSFQR